MEWLCSFSRDWDTDGHAKLYGESAHLRGLGGLRHADGIQWTLRSGGREIAGGHS